MAELPQFSLWLEFEHTEPQAGEDPADDFANVLVQLPDGRRYALNVWTFKFFHRARTSGPPPDEYLIAPDLFVERLDRPTVERVVSALLARGEMKLEWLCAPDSDGEVT